MSHPTGREGAKGAAFPDTLWSVVLAAGRPEPGVAAEALRALCVIYRDPMVAWLERVRPGVGEPEDLAHDFLAHLLARERLTGIDRSQGRFRTWLLRCLKNFVNDRRDAARAAKRGGGIVPVGLEDAEMAAPNIPPDLLLDLGFARSLHVRAMDSIRREWVESGRGEAFEQLRRYVLRRPEVGEYEEVAAVLGWKPTKVKRAVVDLRDAHFQAFRGLVRDIVAPTDLGGGSALPDVVVARRGIGGRIAGGLTPWAT
jgi:DNA-directed RNA polymerase specialized sigma24 family protein